MIPALLRRQSARLIATATVVALYGAARLPALDEDLAAELASRYRFTAIELPGPTSGRSIREVHPELEHIAGWISSVGAAVALGDLDGNGLPDDLVLVDPRTDRVDVRPVPGTGERFAPLALEPAPLPYDRRTMAPMGAIPCDGDEDGRLDVLVYYWGRTPVLFLRRGEGFEPREVLAGGERWFTNAATFADVDGDGHADLVVGNYFADGHAILDASGAGEVSMQGSMSHSRNGGHKHLLLWTGPGHYEEVEGAFEGDWARGWSLGLGAADLDGDLLPELYFANDFGPDHFLHNRSTPGAPRFAPLEGERSFATPTSCVVGRDSFKGMGVDFGDVDGDGALDVYVSNITTELGLQESQLCFLATGDTDAMRGGRAPFVDAAERLGLARSSWCWEARLADFDNDGVLEAMQATGFVAGEIDRWPELHELALGNDATLRHPASWPRFGAGDDVSGREPNAFFARSDSGRYFDVAERVGLGAPVVSRGVATADWDGDGDLDLAVANQWAPSAVYRNDAPAPGAFLGLRLLLPLSGSSALHAEEGLVATRGRAAIGAAATVRLADGRRLVGQVDGGNGHSGVRSPELHFGLGDLEGPLEVELAWRDPAGAPRRTVLSLRPGWHTILLPWNEPPIEMGER